MANMVKIQQWRLAFCLTGVVSLSPPSPWLSLSPSVVLVLTCDLRGGEDTLSVRGRQRNKLNVKGCRDGGFLSRSRFEVIMGSDT